MNDDDLHEIRAALRADAAAVGEALWGPPNKALSSRKNLRWGTKGSRSLEITGPKRGLWVSFEGGGGDMLAAIRDAHGCSFTDALEWARSFTGVGTPKPGYTPPPPPPEPEPDEDRAAEQTADAAARILTAQRIAAGGIALAGTLGETYLTQVRGIPVPAAGWPHSILWHPVYRAVLAVATTPDGIITAVQRIHLAEDGGKIGAEEMQSRRLIAAKITNGIQAGAAVRLPGGDAAGPLLVAEGPETGLSVWATTGHETWITLGSIAKAELQPGRKTVLCADDDPPPSDTKLGGAARALIKALRDWRRAGVDAVKATPFAQPKGDRRDFNDLIQEAGADAVRARIEAALAPVQPEDMPVRTSLKAARATLNRVVGEFFDVARRWSSPANGEPVPPVHMIQTIVGSGKSTAGRLGAAAMLVQMRTNKDERSLALAVPTHRLGDEQAARFEMLTDEEIRGLEQQADAFMALPQAKALGLTARVWRGRSAPDPHSPGKTMCQDLEAVDLVQKVLGDATKLVCGKDDGPQCQFSPRCAYQWQKRNDPPDLWIVAHQLLFQQPAREMGKIAAVIVDEAFWPAGLVSHKAFPLDALDPPKGGLSSLNLTILRGQLQAALRDVPDGPLPRAALTAALITPENAGEAHALEWARKVEVQMHPGMPMEERRQAHAAALVNRDVARMAALWTAVGALVADDGPERSGWVELTRNDEGARMLEVQGRAKIRKAWQAPTLVLDAVLRPDLVRLFYPQAKLVAEVDVAAPHQHIRQVEDKAYAKGMYAPMRRDETGSYVPVPEDSKPGITARNNLRKLRAMLTREARRHAPERVLVVVQKAVQEALVRLGRLPSNVDLAHHNAVAGLDHWKGVRAMIVVGRTMPAPAAVASLTAQLTGRAIEPLAGWYPKVPATREMTDGTFVAAEADRHPDPVAEALRWQIAEGELVQIIGRARGINRGAANPVDILLMCDLPLPMPVDRLMTAADLDPDAIDEMLAEGGVALLNPRDAAAVYRGLWLTERAASDCFRREKWYANAYKESSIGVCVPLLRVAYQTQGQGCRLVEALVDREAVPDPRAWLEAKLGPLAKFQAQEPPPAEAEPAPPPAAEPPGEAPPMPEDIVAPGWPPEHERTEQVGLDPALLYPGRVVHEPPVGLWKIYRPVPAPDRPAPVGGWAPVWPKRPPHPPPWPGHGVAA